MTQLSGTPAVASPNLAGVPGSETLRISSLAAELRRAGRSIVSLSAGEPDFDTPEHIRAAGAAAIAEGKTRYTPTAGVAPLREAIAEKLERENGIRRTPDEVLVSAGAKQVLFNACMALFGPGDEVLIPAPYWVSFPPMVRLARATPVIVTTGLDRGWKVDPEGLRQHLTPRTRGLILNSPSNPTGAVYDKQELAGIAEFCVAHGLWILSDEIYETLCYDSAEAAGAPSIAGLDPEVAAHTVTVNGFSKTYAMTGWRIGYGAAPRAAIEAMEIVQSHCSSNASSVGQAAALAALTEREASRRAVTSMRSAFERRRGRLVAGLDGLEGVANRPPDGAFYLFSDVRGVLDSRGAGSSASSADDFCDWLLREHGLA
ncbi:MAG: pyridoxal phosphate-dependent aminotransferase, partial [Gemmatimonadetes bacterium]|nr:pyridoxal phosphate-dependent aminotransferase [Gemmatimonadota bacterium]